MLRALAAGRTSVSRARHSWVRLLVGERHVFCPETTGNHWQVQRKRADPLPKSCFACSPESWDYYTLLRLSNIWYSKVSMSRSSLKSAQSMRLEGLPSDESHTFMSCSWNLGPWHSPTTVPRLELATQPTRPSAFAFWTVQSLKNTPCTRPCTSNLNAPSSMLLYHCSPDVTSLDYIRAGNLWQ